MKKTLVIAIIALALLGTSIGAYAWWDNLQQTRSNDLTIGYGVRLVVDGKVEDVRQLVPAGSFYAAYQEDYTTSYQIVYTLSLEEPLKDGMTADLNVDLTSFVLGTYADGYNNVASPISIDVNGLGLSATGEWNVEDAFTFGDNEVTVTVTITLADNGADFASDYAAIKGQTPTFDLGFTVVNTSSSVAPANPLQ
ncbi:MAG: hypothetical protein WC509_06255 [Candidatus Izemoplasmatales bacterium]